MNIDPLMHEAITLVDGARDKDYGNIHEVFGRYAAVWTALLGKKLHAPLTASDVALLMAGLKLARQGERNKRDNIVDAHGYLLIHSRILDHEAST